MRPFSLSIIVLIFLATLGPNPAALQAQGTSGFWPSPEPGAKPKVLLVGWDGIRPDILAEVPTPNLDALAKAGTFSGEAQTARPTVSGPCWSSILTGVWPQKHRVISNNFSSSRYDLFPDVFTLIESVRPELRTFAVADWLPLVTEDANGPLIGEAVDEKIVLDGYDLGWLEADSVSVEHALEVLRGAEAPDMSFVYIGAPDEISHNISGIGKEYRDAIATADVHLGRLVEAIRGRASFPREDWLILVATDHGRTEEGGHGGSSPEETTVFYLASGPSAGVGTPAEAPSVVDLVPTALAHLGVEIDPAWELDGRVVGIGR